MAPANGIVFVSDSLGFDGAGGGSGWVAGGWGWAAGAFAWADCASPAPGWPRESCHQISPPMISTPARAVAAMIRPRLPRSTVGAASRAALDSAVRLGSPDLPIAPGKGDAEVPASVS